MFNNETGLYEEAPWMEQGVWLQHEDGRMWIVPPVGAVAEIEGPDDPILDILNSACRYHGYVPSGYIESLGLMQVPDVLKRFNEVDGYYHA